MTDFDDHYDWAMAEDGTLVLLESGEREGLFLGVNITTKSGNPWHDARTGQFDNAPPGIEIKQGEELLKFISNISKHMIDAHVRAVGAKSIAVVKTNVPGKIKILAFDKSGNAPEQSLVVDEVAPENADKAAKAGVVVPIAAGSPGAQPDPNAPAAAAPAEDAGAQGRWDAVATLAARTLPDFELTTIRDFVQGKSKRELTPDELVKFTDDTKTAFKELMVTNFTASFEGDPKDSLSSTNWVADNAPRLSPAEQKEIETALVKMHGEDVVSEWQQMLDGPSYGGGEAGPSTKTVELPQRASVAWLKENMKRLTNDQLAEFAGRLAKPGNKEKLASITDELKSRKMPFGGGKGMRPDGTHIPELKPLTPGEKPFEADKVDIGDRLIGGGLRNPPKITEEETQAKLDEARGVTRTRAFLIKKGDFVVDDNGKIARVVQISSFVSGGQSNVKGSSGSTSQIDLQSGPKPEDRSDMWIGSQTLLQRVDPAKAKGRLGEPISSLAGDERRVGGATTPISRGPSTGVDDIIPPVSTFPGKQPANIPGQTSIDDVPAPEALSPIEHVAGDGWPELEELKFVKDLGGSTGAKLMQAPDGEKYVMKSGGSDGHIVEEANADALYQMFGLAVPEFRLYNEFGVSTKLAQFVDGEMLSSLAHQGQKDQLDLARTDLARGFAIDAFLASWDVTGMEDDNVMWAGGQAFRIDNGGSLRYRAQGKPKGGAFGSHVGELDSMRGLDPDIGTFPSTEAAFGKLTNNEIALQIQQHFTEANRRLMKDLVKDPELRGILNSRWNDMTSWAVKNGDQPALPVDATEILDVPITNEPKLPPFTNVSTGMLVVDSEGRLLTVAPLGAYGSYKVVFPKGQHEPELSAQQNAHKEVMEEAGVSGATVTGWLGDFQGSMGITRYYIAQAPEGVVPKPGIESENAKFQTIEDILATKGIKGRERAVINAFETYDPNAVPTVDSNGYEVYKGDRVYPSGDGPVNYDDAARVLEVDFLDHTVRLEYPDGSIAKEDATAIQILTPENKPPVTPKKLLQHIFKQMQLPDGGRFVQLLSEDDTNVAFDALMAMAPVYAGQAKRQGQLKEALQQHLESFHATDPDVEIVHSTLGSIGDEHTVHEASNGVDLATSTHDFHSEWGMTSGDKLPNDFVTMLFDEHAMYGLDLDELVMEGLEPAQLLEFKYRLDGMDVHAIDDDEEMSLKEKQQYKDAYADMRQAMRDGIAHQGIVTVADHKKSLMGAPVRKDSSRPYASAPDPPDGHEPVAIQKQWTAAGADAIKVGDFIYSTEWPLGVTITSIGLTSSYELDVIGTTPSGASVPIKHTLAPRTIKIWAHEKLSSSWPGGYSNVDDAYNAWMIGDLTEGEIADWMVGTTRSQIWALQAKFEEELPDHSASWDTLTPLFEQVKDVRSGTAVQNGNGQVVPAPDWKLVLTQHKNGNISTTSLKVMFEELDDAELVKLFGDFDAMGGPHGEQYSAMVKQVQSTRAEEKITTLKNAMLAAHDAFESSFGEDNEQQKEYEFENAHGAWMAALRDLHGLDVYKYGFNTTAEELMVLPSGHIAALFQHARMDPHGSLANKTNVVYHAKTGEWLSEDLSNQSVPIDFENALGEKPGEFERIADPYTGEDGTKLLVTHHNEGGPAAYEYVDGLTETGAQKLFESLMNVGANLPWKYDTALQEIRDLARSKLPFNKWDIKLTHNISLFGQSSLTGRVIKINDKSYRFALPGGEFVTLQKNSYKIGGWAKPQKPVAKKADATGAAKWLEDHGGVLSSDIKDLTPEQAFAVYKHAMTHGISITYPASFELTEVLETLPTGSLMWESAPVSFVDLGESVGIHTKIMVTKSLSSPGFLVQLSSLELKDPSWGDIDYVKPKNAPTWSGTGFVQQYATQQKGTQIAALQKLTKEQILEVWIAARDMGQESVKISASKEHKAQHGAYIDDEMANGAKPNSFGVKKADLKQGQPVWFLVQGNAMDGIIIGHGQYGPIIEMDDGDHVSPGLDAITKHGSHLDGGHIAGFTQADPVVSKNAPDKGVGKIMTMGAVNAYVAWPDGTTEVVQVDTLSYAGDNTATTDHVGLMPDEFQDMINLATNDELYSEPELDQPFIDMLQSVSTKQLGDAWGIWNVLPPDTKAEYSVAIGHVLDALENRPSGYAMAQSGLEDAWNADGQHSLVSYKAAKKQINDLLDITNAPPLPPSKIEHDSKASFLGDAELLSKLDPNNDSLFAADAVVPGGPQYNTGEDPNFTYEEVGHAYHSGPAFAHQKALAAKNGGKSGVHAYVNGKFGQMTKHLRGWQNALTGSYATQVENWFKSIDKWFEDPGSALDRNIVVYRNIGGSGDGGTSASIIKQINSAQEGDVYIDHSFASTDWNGHWGGGPGSLTYKILVPKGWHVWANNHASGGPNSGENEFFIDRGARMICRGKDAHGIMTFEIIGQVKRDYMKFYQETHGLKTSWFTNPAYLKNLLKKIRTASVAMMGSFVKSPNDAHSLLDKTKDPEVAAKIHEFGKGKLEAAVTALEHVNWLNAINDAAAMAGAETMAPLIQLDGTEKTWQGDMSAIAEISGPLGFWESAEAVAGSNNTKDDKLAFLQQLLDFAKLNRASLDLPAGQPKPKNPKPESWDKAIGIITAQLESVKTGKQVDPVTPSSSPAPESPSSATPIVAPSHGFDIDLSPDEPGAFNVGDELKGLAAAKLPVGTVIKIKQAQTDAYTNPTTYTHVDGKSWEKSTDGSEIQVNNTYTVQIQSLPADVDLPGLPEAPEFKIGDAVSTTTGKGSPHVGEIVAIDTSNPSYPIIGVSFDGTKVFPHQPSNLVLNDPTPVAGYAIGDKVTRADSSSGIVGTITGFAHGNVIVDFGDSPIAMSPQSLKINELAGSSPEQLSVGGFAIGDQVKRFLTGRKIGTVKGFSSGAVIVDFGPGTGGVIHYGPDQLVLYKPVSPGEMKAGAEKLTKAAQTQPTDDEFDAIANVGKGGQNFYAIGGAWAYPSEHMFKSTGWKIPQWNAMRQLAESHGNVSVLTSMYYAALHHAKGQSGPWMKRANVLKAALESLGVKL